MPVRADRLALPPHGRPPAAVCAAAALVEPARALVVPMTPLWSSVLLTALGGRRPTAGECAALPFAALMWTASAGGWACLLPVTAAQHIAARAATRARTALHALTGTDPVRDRTRCWTCGAPQDAHPYRHPFRRVPRPTSPEDHMTADLDTPAADHDPTTVLRPHPERPGLRRVRVTCSCLQWEAEGTVNTSAPAFRDGHMEARLHALHADHRHELAEPS
jgi:hypothetical protein